MTAAQFAEFWRMQGHRVFATAECWWYDPYPLAFQSIPFHRVLAQPGTQIASVLLRGPAAAARYLCPRGSQTGGGLFVCTERDYGPQSLTHKSRNRTSVGLKVSAVERITPAALATDGYALVADTLQRQGRDPASMSAQAWSRYCRAVGQTRDCEVWACIRGGRLASLLVAALVEDHYTFLYQASRTEDLPHAVNNALIYCATRHGLAVPGARCVCYGLKSIESTSGLDRFKQGMGFQLRELTDTTVLNPLLAAGLACGGRAAIKWLAGHRPASDFWRKACRLVHAAEATAEGTAA